MPRLRRWLTLGVPAAAIAAGLTFAGHRMLDAADHFDPPARVGTAFGNHTDPAADIADLYAFHDANNLYLALNFGGPSDPALRAFYDRNVLYTINLSNDGNRTTVEFPIEIRFGQDGQFNGVRVTNLPPANRTIQGSVETNLVGENGIIVRAGLFDDPFFFDQMGLAQTRQTGTLSFSNQRNPFGGRNITFVVIQIPRGLIDRGQPLDVWSTSARIGS
jgi:hypothetical protein